MHEAKKLKEAEYFLSQMEQTIDDFEKYYFNLSAFLSSARSVLQFCLKEAETKAGGQAWYDGQVTTKPIVKFFKDKRDINIHSNPLDIARSVNIQIQDTISISDSIHIVVRDKDGNIKDEYKSEPEVPPKKEFIPPVTSYSHQFDDWTGSEDVATLCSQYLAELKVIVQDGQSKSFITA
jgi:hypothetical protein